MVRRIRTGIRGIYQGRSLSNKKDPRAKWLPPPPKSRAPLPRELRRALRQLELGKKGKRWPVPNGEACDLALIIGWWEPCLIL